MMNFLYDLSSVELGLAVDKLAFKSRALFSGNLWDDFDKMEAIHAQIEAIILGLYFVRRDYDLESFWFDYLDGLRIDLHAETEDTALVDTIRLSLNSTTAFLNYLFDDH